jgi:hypothetical protein
MGAESNSVAAKSSSQHNIETHKQSKERSVEQVYQSNCRECLKSSILTKSSQRKLNIEEAIQKIELVEQSAPKNLRGKLKNLITQLTNTDPSGLASSKSIDQLLTKVFQNPTATQPSMQAQSVQASLHSGHRKNPFKQENPFAPKPLKVQTLAKSTNQNTNKPKTHTQNPEQEESDPTTKKSKSLFSVIMNCLKHQKT